MVLAFPDNTLQELEALVDAGQTDVALVRACQYFDSDPGDRRLKLFLLRVLRQHSDLALPENKPAVHKLLNDPVIDPHDVAPAAWNILRRAEAALLGPSSEAAANWLETNAFALDLLRQVYVSDLEIETALTSVRRWLLLSGRWPEFPLTTQALIDQASLNGGVWLFDSEERAALDADPAARIVQAFRPPRPQQRQSITFANPTTDAVAQQYEGWPYPHWTRVTQWTPTTLAATIRKYDPDGPDTIPAEPRILVAGCGTGSECALVAFGYPDAKITAIDISRSSLAYAVDHCAAAGLTRIEFRLLPIHRVAELSGQFDAIFCSGVLHHLPDPEAGWTALTEVLKPGGVMQIMLYSKLARLIVQAWRKSIPDLLGQPVDDDLLREVRRRVIAAGKAPVQSLDFFTIGGVHDLLLHRHEDPFDVARIQRNIDRLSLKLLRFQLPTDADKAAYRRDHPEDPLFRDYAQWTACELRNPMLFSSMYRFWCRKPL